MLRSVGARERLEDQIRQLQDSLNCYQQLGTLKELAEAQEMCQRYYRLGTPDHIEGTLDKVMEFVEFHKEELKKRDDQIASLEQEIKILRQHYECKLARTGTQDR